MVKEVCQPCSKTINIGHSILECEVCHTAIHTKCFKSSGFCSSNNLWVCQACSFKIVPRYNPFALLNKGDSEKFYDAEAGGEEETVSYVSDIFDQCQNYKLSELNKVRSSLSQNQNSCRFDQFSSYFINIDGNASNFDSLLAEIECTCNVIDDYI